MKRLICFVMILIVAIPILAQSYKQNDGKSLGAWPQDEFIIQERSATTSEYFTDVQFGDTLYSKIYRIWPYMYIEAEIADTSTAIDSLKTRIKMYAGMRKDTTGTGMTYENGILKYVKELTWTWDSTRSAQAYIDTSGIWWSNLNSSAFPGLSYWMLEIITLNGHGVEPGISFKFRCKTHLMDQ